MTAADDAATPPEDGVPAAATGAPEPTANAEAAPAAPEPQANAEAAAAEPTPIAPAETAEASDSAAAPPTEAAAKDADAEPPPPPPPDPATCQGIVIGQLAFETSVLAGEFDDSDFLFYLEPAGVLNANLVCTRAYPAETIRGGILMTKAARDAKKVFFDDGVNPDDYELSFPKEFGYVKSLQHYVPESREHAKFPWSKKY